MKWERLTAIRTALLILTGLGCLVAGAWSVATWLGLLALGASLLLLEFLTGERPEEQGARR